jgi:branched-chain amino acid transport system ATP-binding protein
MVTPLLEVEDLRTGYGRTIVLDGVSLSVNEGKIAAILGLNGAGKTTTLMSIAGLLRPWGGRILFDGVPVTKLDPSVLVRRGIVLVPEGRHVFASLSVEHNLRLGAWAKRKDRKLYERNLQMAFGLFPRLQERRGQLAGTLSGGEQQMLALARGLMADPRLLLIDEASQGLAPKVAEQVFQAVLRITGEGVTVLMVEQSAGILRHVDHAFVMEKGKIIFEGSGSAILESGDLRKAYLGAPA